MHVCSLPLASGSAAWLHRLAGASGSPHPPGVSRRAPIIQRCLIYSMALAGVGDSGGVTCYGSAVVRAVGLLKRGSAVVTVSMHGQLGDGRRAPACGKQMPITNYSVHTVHSARSA